MAVKSRKHPDWSRSLPAPLQILDGDKPILTLATVGDVRDLIVKRLPEESRQKSTWQYLPTSRSMPRTAPTTWTCRLRCVADRGKRQDWLVPFIEDLKRRR